MLESFLDNSFFYINRKLSFTQNVTTANFPLCYSLIVNHGDKLVVRSMKYNSVYAFAQSPFTYRIFFLEFSIQDASCQVPHCRMTYGIYAFAQSTFTYRIFSLESSIQDASCQVPDFRMTCTCLRNLYSLTAYSFSNS